jgi:CubicO group peptidase (beta-lactamase class C family)
MTRRDIFALSLAALTTPARVGDSTMQNAFQLIQTQIDNGTLHHAVLHVQKGAEVTVKAFGKAKPDSMFLLGSITKPLTAAAVMLLVDRGEVKLSDAAVKVLPEFNEGGQNPAEAVFAGKPVLFGPHMENFSPLLDLLLRHHGAMRVLGV